MVIPSTPCSENTGEAPLPKLTGGVGGRTVCGNREGLPRPPRQRKCVSLSDPQSMLGIVVKLEAGGETDVVTLWTPERAGRAGTELEGAYHSSR